MKLRKLVIGSALGTGIALVGYDWYLRYRTAREIDGLLAAYGRYHIKSPG